MIYKAYPIFTNRLLELPETGMGYQLIEARRAGNPYSERFIVYNAELILDFDEKFSDNKRLILNEGFEFISRRTN